MCEYLKHHKIRRCPNSTDLRKEVVLRCEMEGDDFSNKTKEYTIKPANGKIGEVQSPFYHQVFVTRKVQKSISNIRCRWISNLYGPKIGLYCTS